MASEGVECGTAGNVRAGRVAGLDGVFDGAAEAMNQSALGWAERDVAAEAAGAGAVALAERIRRRGEKGDVARSGTARGTTGTAENSGGANGENEAAVEGGVAGGDGAPPAARGGGTAGPRGSCVGSRSHRVHGSTLRCPARACYPKFAGKTGAALRGCGIGGRMALCERKAAGWKPAVRNGAGPR